MDNGLFQILWVILALMGGAVVIALAGLFWMVRSIRDLDVPPNAGYFTTMHYVPVTLVVLLDLLDFGLDIFAAPISWLVLNKMGLAGLRNKAALEALIPFTQPIPTFTISWILARVLNLGEQDVPGAAYYPPERYLEDEQYAPQETGPRPAQGDRPEDGAMPRASRRIT